MRRVTEEELAFYDRLAERISILLAHPQCPLAQSSLAERIGWNRASLCNFLNRIGRQRVSDRRRPRGAHRAAPRLPHSLERGPQGGRPHARVSGAGEEVRRPGSTGRPQPARRPARYRRPVIAGGSSGAKPSRRTNVDLPDQRPSSYEAGIFGLRGPVGLPR